MKTTRWNLGIIVLAFGSAIRKYQTAEEANGSIRWLIGVRILQFGFWLRGNIPQKHWGEWVHFTNLNNSISKYL